MCLCAVIWFHSKVEMRLGFASHENKEPTSIQSTVLTHIFQVDDIALLHRTCSRNWIRDDTHIWETNSCGFQQPLSWAPDDAGWWWRGANGKWRLIRSCCYYCCLKDTEYGDKTMMRYSLLYCRWCETCAALLERGERRVIAMIDTAMCWRKWLRKQVGEKHRVWRRHTIWMDVGSIGSE